MDQSADANTLLLLSILDDLSRLKIDALKEYRTAAQEKYREHLDAYVKGVLGHPLENLSVGCGWCHWHRFPGSFGFTAPHISIPLRSSLKASSD